MVNIPLDRPECCPKHLPPMPKDVACFCRELSTELNALHRRHKSMFVKRPRIMEMAIPKSRREKIVYKCPCLLKRPIEIVHLDKRVRTRTEQLALPSVWKLLYFKNEVKHQLPAKRMYFLNRLIRSSLLSLYSHLHNVQPPKEPVKKTRWTKKDWEVHGKKFEEMAQPKPEPEQPKIQRMSKPLSELKRYKRMCIPKKYPSDEPPVWKFTPAMKNYKPSDRVKEISTPRKFEEEPLPHLPPESALKYKPSARIKELSEPLVKKSGGDNDLKENPFAISPNALKAKPSQRTKELAEPREFENTHIREDPTAISPAALKAKASPRTIELAKPKGS